MSRYAVENEFDIISNIDAYSINDENIAASICANYRLLNEVSFTQKIAKRKFVVKRQEKNIQDMKAELNLRTILKVTN